MGLLSNIAAETLKSTGAGMSKTLREQAQEARNQALLNKKMQHDKDIAQTNRDARIESEVLQDHLAKGRSKTEMDFKAEQNRQNRSSNERVANMRGQSKSYLDPAVSAKVDVLKSEMAALAKNDLSGDAQSARMTEIRSEIDQLLGFKAKQAPGPSLQTTQTVSGLVLPGGTHRNAKQRKLLSELETEAETQRTTTGGQYATGAPSQANLQPMEAAAQVISGFSQGKQVSPDLVKMALPYLPPQFKAQAEALLGQRKGLLQ